MKDELAIIREQLNALILRVQTVEIQLQMMEPTELIKFRAKVLKTLSVIDSDLDKINEKLDEFSTRQQESIPAVKTEIAVLKTKVIIYTSIISTLAALALSTAAKWLIG